MSGLPKSAIDSMNKMRAALANPGRAKGNVTLRNTSHLLAPKVEGRFLQRRVQPFQNAFQRHVSDGEERHHLGEYEARACRRWRNHATPTVWT